MNSMTKRAAGAILPIIAVFATAFFAVACEPSTTVEPVFGSASLYAVDTFGGGVYGVDGDVKIAAETPTVSTGQNSSGEIVFHGGLGYVAVGSYGNTAPGLYVFDPEDPDAGATRIGDAISAQYIAFASDTLGYVSSADYTPTYENALYSFNPSDPGAGLTWLIDLAYPQDIAIGSDGRVYVAQNYTDYVDPSNNVMNVVRLTTACNAIGIQFGTSSDGPTGLLAGSYKGDDGIFVANTGDWATGSVDFITGLSIVQVVEGPVADALAFLDADRLIVTGGYGPARTFVIDLSAATPVAVELFYHENESFGGGDATLVDGEVFIPDGAQAIYAIDAALNVVRIVLGDDSMGITNVGAPE